MLTSNWSPHSLYIHSPVYSTHCTQLLHPSKVQLSLIASLWFYLLINQRFLTQSCLFQTLSISLDSLCVSTFPKDKLSLGTLKTSCSSVYQDHWHNASVTWNISSLHVNSCTSLVAQLESFFLQEVLFVLLNWNIIGLQCCINFRCTAHSVIYIYMYICVFLCVYIWICVYSVTSVMCYSLRPYGL